MSFVLQNPDTPRKVAGWPVVIPTAIDGGNVRKDEITVDFELPPQGVVDGIIEAARAGGRNTDSDLLREHVVGWGCVNGPDGNPVAFDADSLESMLSITTARVALAGAFLDALHGRKAARKN